jgi:hypothetical protein
MKMKNSKIVQKDEKSTIEKIFESGNCLEKIEKSHRENCATCLLNKKVKRQPTLIEQNCSDYEKENQENDYITDIYLLEKILKVLRWDDDHYGYNDIRELLKAYQEKRFSFIQDDDPFIDDEYKLKYLERIAKQNVVKCEKCHVIQGFKDCDFYRKIAETPSYIIEAKEKMIEKDELRKIHLSLIEEEREKVKNSDLPEKEKRKQINLLNKRKKEIEEKYAQEYEVIKEKGCVSCSRVATHAISKCGHFCLCENCGLSAKKCPVCDVIYNSKKDLIKIIF